MEVSVITKYKTADGRVFTDKTRAEEHEERLKNKTLHYIVDFAHLIVHKAYYLSVKSTALAGHDSPFRTYIYETESGVVITDDTIEGNASIIIMSEAEYQNTRSHIDELFKQMTHYQKEYATTKFALLPPKKAKRKR